MDANLIFIIMLFDWIFCHENKPPSFSRRRNMLSLLSTCLFGMSSAEALRGFHVFIVGVSLAAWWMCTCVWIMWIKYGLDQWNVLDAIAMLNMGLEGVTRQTLTLSCERPLAPAPALLLIPHCVPGCHRQQQIFPFLTPTAHIYLLTALLYICRSYYLFFYIYVFNHKQQAAPSHCCFIPVP